jgi:hypothetical protein
MKPNVVLLFFFFAMNQAIGADGSPANSNEETIAKLISREEDLARLSCERIKGDFVWKQVADAINERFKLTSSISENEQWPSHIFVGRYSTSARELEKSNLIYLKIHEEFAAKAPGFRSNLAKTRAARVLRICGEDLFRQGLLPKAASVSPDEFKKKIDDLSSVLKKHDDTWIGIARDSRGQSAARVEEDLSAASYNANVDKKTRDGVIRYVWFPMHDIYKNGEALFASEFNYGAFKEDNDKAIISNNSELNKNRERSAQSDKDKENRLAQNKERELRINRIKNGDIKSAKSCAEVAVGLIGEKNLGGNYEMLLSKDFQDVHVKPTNEIYAGIGKTIDSDKSTITVLQSDEFRKKQFVFTLRHDKQTLWFGDKFALGGYLTFVGRYVDNMTVQMRQGNEMLKIQSRVYDVMCVSSR